MTAEKERPSFLQEMSPKEFQRLEKKISAWVSRPELGKRWIVLRHGMIVHRLGDMILRGQYESSAQLKDDLREFQDWAAVFLEMSFKFVEEKRAAKNGDADEKGAEAEEHPSDLPWQGGRAKRR